MAHKTVETTIEAYLRANWAHGEIRVENDVQTPPDGGAPFLTLQFPFSETKRWPVNQRRYREEGGFRIVMAVPSGERTTQIQDWGEELRSLFIDRKINRVDCRVPSSVFVDGSYDEGPYILASIVVPFEFNFTA